MPQGQWEVGEGIAPYRGAWTHETDVTGGGYDAATDLRRGRLGTEVHRVWMTDREGEPLGDRAFRHGSEGLAALADWVVAGSAGDAGAVVVAIEVPRGAVVETLLERGCQVWDDRQH